MDTVLLPTIDIPDHTHLPEIDDDDATVLASNEAYQLCADSGWRVSTGAAQ